MQVDICKSIPGNSRGGVGKWDREEKDALWHQLPKAGDSVGHASALSQP